MSSVSPAIRTTLVSATAVGAVLGLSGCGALLSVIGGGNVFELNVGDCFVEEELNAAFGSEKVSDVPLVDCAEPHDSEFFYAEDMAEGDFPGEAAVDAAVEDVCYGDNFTDFVGVPYTESEIYAGALFPDATGWENFDDREIICYVFTEEMVTGTLEGANR
ncbi:septum formation family protein [Nocardiopsis sp. EMB25]|uniref:hypothetical protein n=1 Tax=Nocardiopsis TaxID=2013 RepID=UPI00034B6653|nr:MULTISPECIES: hypothetical protein [Nocardiopsis]MCY9782429.1 septum formation family protein [Nocardiopsis sp. EMB25]